MSSYDALVGYGTDEFYVNSDDLDSFASEYTPDYLRGPSVSKIRDRELRMMNKVNQYMPTCDYNKHQTNIDYCQKQPDMYSLKGVYDQQKRQSRRENIEKHYFSGREIRVKGDCDQASPIKQNIQQPAPVQQHKSKKEGFSGGNQQEVVELQQKNDMLVFFIFILAVVIIVQFFKRQTPKYVHVFPIGPQFPNHTMHIPSQSSSDQPSQSSSDQPSQSSSDKPG